VGKLKQTLATVASEAKYYMRDIILKQIDGRYLAFSKSLNIYGVNSEDDSIFLTPHKDMPLYGIQLEGMGNIKNYAKDLENTIHSLFHDDNCKVFMFFCKSPVLLNDKEDNFCTKQSIYLFSYSKILVEGLSYSFSVDMMTSQQLTNALFDITLINRYQNHPEDFSLKSIFGIEDVKVDEMHFGVKAMFAEGLYNALSKEGGYKLFQGEGSGSMFFGNKPEMHSIFALPWTGYISFTFNFSQVDVKRHIQTEIKDIKDFETNKEVREDHRQLGRELDDEMLSSLCITNSVALIDNPKVINRIGSMLNIPFIEKFWKRKEIIYSTPIRARDTAYDKLSMTNNVIKMICSIHKQQNTISPSSKDVYGKDISGNYVTYSFSETGESLHSAVLAPPRSGKTFFIISTMNQLLGGEIAPKSELEYQQDLITDNGATPKDKVIRCRNIDNINIVHFDTGESAKPYVKELKRTYPKKVTFYDENINNLRFGLTNIGYDYETKTLNSEDVVFSITIINLILSLNGDTTITALEANEFTEAILRIYEEDTYRGAEIQELEAIGGYEENIERLREFAKENNLEFTKYTRTTELGLRGTEFDFMQKPLMRDIVKEIVRKSDATMVEKTVSELCKKLSAKLGVITGSETFSFYAKSNIEEAQYFYMELQRIKDLGEKFFLPIFMSIFQKLYQLYIKKAQYIKERGGIPPKVFIIIEEAHNFTKMEMMMDLLDVVAREASRYNIHLIFITHSPNDIGAELLQRIGTRIVMPSSSFSGSDLKPYWSRKDEEENQSYFDFYDNHAKKFFALAHYGKGLFSIKLPVSKSEERLFNSNPTKIKVEE